MPMPTIVSLLDEYTVSGHEFWEWFVIDSFSNYLIKHGRRLKAYELELLLWRWINSTPETHRPLQLLFLVNWADICKKRYQELAAEDRAVCYANGNPAAVAGRLKVAGVKQPDDLIVAFAACSSKERQWRQMQDKFNEKPGIFTRFKYGILSEKYIDPKHIRIEQPCSFTSKCSKCGKELSSQNLAKYRGSKTGICSTCRSIGYR